MVAPARTPKAIVEKLNAETMKALVNSDARKKFDDLGVLLARNTPEEFGEFMRTEAAKWAKVAKAAKIKPE